MPNILYLLSHKTLTDFEIPIMRNKGYNCYIPKKFNSLSSVNSINYITPFDCDKFLNISQSDIAVLNNIDFFNNNTLLNSQHLKIINDNFSCIFVTLLTTNKMLTQLVYNFHGKIYFRFFGLDGTKTYRTLMKRMYHPTLYKSNKIQFIFSYKEIIDFELGLKENDIFTLSNSYYIPLGLPELLVKKNKNTYNPLNNKIAFICSRTDDGMRSYYGRIYNKFINEFQRYQYIIFGKNNNKISHLPYIKNNLNDKEYYSQISQCKCLFYHGVEERHLHYHPLEAIIIGIPVIFFEKSLLSTSYLNDSEGKCKNYDDAKIKINKIINNDERLIKSIIDSQNIVISQLLVSTNLDIFDKLFSNI